MDVSNPGPVDDAVLDSQEAFEAVVNGAGRALSFALGSGTAPGMGFDAAAVARELHPAGQTGSFGIDVRLGQGFITPEETGGGVDKAQTARWIAEDAVRRVREVLGDAEFAESPLAAQALLYVGYSNRYLGDHVCETVIDGGPPEPFTIHFERAEAAFTEALASARAANQADLANAALVGRASVLIWQGRWAEALADAEQVPKTFKFTANYNNLERDQLNSYYFATSGTQFRNMTVWHTWYGENYDEFADSRTLYVSFPEDHSWRFGQGAVGDLGDGRGPLGQVPFWQQQKHTEEASPIDLADGREAMLITAEGRLRNGDIAGAMAIVNELRADANVALRQTPANAAEAWSYLKLEKLIELWLESRAIGERRRWNGDGADGPAPGPLPALLRMDDRVGKDTCFPISQTERDTNPNVN